MTDEARLPITSLLASSTRDLPLCVVRDVPDPYTFYISSSSSKSSKRTIRYVLLWAAVWLGATTDRLEEVPWDRIRRPHLIELVYQMLGKGYAPKTIKLYLTALRGVIHQACLLQMVPLSVDCDVKRPIRFPSKPDLLSPRGDPDSAIQLILDCCVSDWRYQGVRDAAVVALLYWAGLQRAEVAAIDIDSVNQVDWTISPVGNNNLTLAVSLDVLAIKYLKCWIMLRNEHISPDGSLFTRIRRGRKLNDDLVSPGEITASGLTAQAVYYIMTERCKEANVSLAPGSLRQAWITNSVKRYGAKATMLMAGSSDLSSIVAHVRYSEDDIRAAMLSSDVP